VHRNTYEKGFPTGGATRWADRHDVRPVSQWRSTPRSPTRCQGRTPAAERLARPWRGPGRRGSRRWTPLCSQRCC